MIEEVVEFYSGIVQLLLVLIVVAGAYMGYELINTDWAPFGKVVVGGGLAFLFSTIFMGPFLVLLDIRNVLRKIDCKSK